MGKSEMVEEQKCPLTVGGPVECLCSARTSASPLCLTGKSWGELYL